MLAFIHLEPTFTANGEKWVPFSKKKNIFKKRNLSLWYTSDADHLNGLIHIWREFEPQNSG